MYTSESILVTEATTYSVTVMCCYQLHGVTSPPPQKRAKYHLVSENLKSSPDEKDMSSSILKTKTETNDILIPNVV